jgi:GntR family transcriptional repressor for pyruvate dehydrogenase complex
MTLPQRKHRSLSQGVVEQISDTIRQGVLKPGDKLPTESSLMGQHGVSRTVVREAITHLQAAGLVQTRHGIGTFVIERVQAGMGLESEHIVTLRDVLAVLELRIGVETETAGLAASRRSQEQADELAAALREMQQAMAEGRPAVEADKRFHLLIAQSTGNRYFVDILTRLGSTRTSPPVSWSASAANTTISTAPSSDATRKPRARRCVPICPTAANVWWKRSAVWKAR